MEVIVEKVREFLRNLIANVISFYAENTISSYFNGREKLKELKQAMEFIQAWFYDSQRLPECDEGKTIQVWLRSLKGILYRLEDLFEAVALADRHYNQMPPSKLPRLVRSNFFSSKINALKMNRKIANEAKDIMGELGLIKAKMDEFPIERRSLDSRWPAQNMPTRREETFPSILEEVIGRGDDNERVVQMLLDSRIDNKVLSVISIVGMGGLGKTTLAKLVYNDQRIREHFELKRWACMSNQLFSFEDLARKVLQSISKDNCCQLGIEELLDSLTEAVDGKKFFLVFDDVWDEDLSRWRPLRALLCKGRQGSRILVTTRSKVTARNMGTVEPYELEGLSNDESWALFKALAFSEGHEEANPRLTRIGKEILKKCGNVPLAIRTVATFLHSRGTEQEWEHFRDGDLRMIEQKENDIMPTLKLSYNHLQLQQKRCFSYCSLYPKDHKYDVQRLIWLWMANGFVESQDEGRTCFMELLRKCFFQEVRSDPDCLLKETCYMPHLIHDLAQQVADDCLFLECWHGQVISNNIMHVQVLNPQCLYSGLSWLSSSKCIRSLIISTWSSFRYPRPSMNENPESGINEEAKSGLNEICSLFLQLRALDMGEGKFESLPKSIGELQHLRYLRVCVSNKRLPEEITRLQFLQTLDLAGSKIEELPSGFSELTCLKNLRLGSDTRLGDMPPEFGKLENLQTLDVFIVGKNNGLNALSMMNLMGHLEIHYKKRWANSISEARMANLSGKKLTVLKLFFADEELVTEVDELLECLKPPSTLEYLFVKGWKGVRFPNWGIDELPKLVELHITDCTRCQHLPPFSGLPLLKTLTMDGCEELDMWDASDDDSDREEGSSINSLDWQCLKCLCTLRLVGIPKLDSLPRGIDGLTMLQMLHICDLPNLRNLPESMGRLPQLQDLWINQCPVLEALPRSFQSLHLQRLKITDCPMLRERILSSEDDRRLIQDIPTVKIYPPVEMGISSV